MYICKIQIKKICLHFFRFLFARGWKIFYIFTSFNTSIIHFWLILIIINTFVDVKILLVQTNMQRDLGLFTFQKKSKICVSVALLKHIFLFFVGIICLSDQCKKTIVISLWWCINIYMRDVSTSNLKQRLNLWMEKNRIILGLCFNTWMKSIMVFRISEEVLLSGQTWTHSDSPPTEDVVECFWSGAFWSCRGGGGGGEKWDLEKAPSTTSFHETTMHPIQN